MGMTNRQLATLAVKLLGVYCLIRLFEFVPLLLLRVGTDLESWVDLGLRLQLALTAGAFALFAVLLIWRSGWFVGLVLPPGEPDGPAEGTATGPGPRGTQGVLFSLVGLVLFAQALPALPSLLVAWNTQGHPLRSSTVVLAWSLGLRLALGVALFLGGGALARLWRRLDEVRRLP